MGFALADTYVRRGFTADTTFMRAGNLLPDEPGNFSLDDRVPSTGNGDKFAPAGDFSPGSHGRGTDRHWAFGVDGTFCGKAASAFLQGFRPGGGKRVELGRVDVQRLDGCGESGGVELSDLR